MTAATPGLLHIRADAGPGIGTGHVRRQLALADEWRRAGGDVELFPLGPLDSHVSHALADTGVPESAGQIPSDVAWIVLDSYRASRVEREHLMSQGRLLVVDDLAQVADQIGSMVLDQNLGASAHDYPAIADHLLGPQYALLRREFSRARDRQATRSLGQRVLITLGGDPNPDVLSRVVDAVASVVPAEEIEIARGERSDMADVMRRIDIAVSAAGSTVWELCALGVPSLLIVVSPNQAGIADALDRVGAAVRTSIEGVGRDVAALLADEPRRAALSSRAATVTDGRGARRVVAALRMSELSVREARMDDAALLLSWANDPDTRRQSFRSEYIDPDEHVSWLAGVLADRGRSLVVVETAAAPVGQVRLDVPPRGPAATVSIGLAPEARGRGLGPSVLLAGIRELRRLTDWRGPIDALIKSTNESSLATFSIGGFRRVDDPTTADVDIARYRLDGD
jgi:UDP-2,4-diacetamido-2,4,6-trideoxy-beta-L-altropyranose hydrolase